MVQAVAGRELFREAAEAASVAELPTEWEQQALETATELFGGSGLLLLGEIHGVAENAEIIYTIARRFGIGTLALEWDHRFHPVVEQYLETGRLDVDAMPRSADGRVTPGHLALLAALRNHGLLDRLVLFDGYAYDAVGEPDFWNRRDERMAEVLIRSLAPDQPALVVAGGLHTLVHPIQLRGEDVSARGRALAASMPGVDVLYPMGVRLAQMQRPVSSGRIGYGSGACNNLGIRPLPTLEAAPAVPRFRLSADGAFVYEVPVATPAIVPYFPDPPDS